MFKKKKNKWKETFSSPHNKSVIKETIEKHAFSN